MDRKRDLNELEQDLQSTSEDLVADAKRLLAIEERKMAMRPDDPQLLEVSIQAEDLVDQINAKTDGELALAEKIHRAR